MIRCLLCREYEKRCEEIQYHHKNVCICVGVLVAVSIPVFTSQLEKSKEAADLANLRAAKAAAVTAYLGEESPIWTTNAATGEKTLVPNTTKLYYNAAKGIIDTTGDAIGKGTATKGGCAATAFGTYTYDESKNVAGQYIQVSVTDKGEVTCEFVTKS